MNIVQDQDVKTAKFWQRLAFVVFAIVLLVVIVFGYWTLQPSEVLIINNGPVPVRPSEVLADGGQVILTVDYCKKSDTFGDTSVSLVGETFGAVVAVNWPDDTSEKGCNKLDIPVPIPAQTPTDTYHFAYKIDYRVNPIKSSTTSFISQSFKVTNVKLQPGDAKPQIQ